MKLDDLVMENYNSLNLNDLHIWRYITNHKEVCSKMTIEELAEKCFVSRTSILRFAKKISLQGFSELKFLLKMEDNNSYELSEQKIESISQGYMLSLHDLDNQNYDEFNKMVFEAKRIFIFGSGNVQHNACKELKRLMFKLNTIVYIVNGKSEYEHLISNVEEGDVLILLSLSGENRQCIDILNQMKKTPCKLISITRKRNNTLAKEVDLPLFFEIPFSDVILIENNRFEPTAIIYVVMEMIFLRYAIYHHSRIQNIG